ncbi:hypothetical protein SK128_001257 [Halocaridina rubra]|uniref:Poly(A) RNA polymerase mitochondrial-like central palm domain-containing protein n=1 Tax=Halocaridina rubra TaxID=373956 RepID=A0AAN8WHG5_HALRR
MSFRNLWRSSNFLKWASRHLSYNSGGNEFIPFDGLVSARRCEARRSLLVEVAAMGSALDLYQVCSEFGTIRQMFHYKTKATSGPREMILIEFADSLFLEKVLKGAVYPTQNSSIIPVHSPLVWLAASKKSKPTNHTLHSGTADLPVPFTSEEKNNDVELLQNLFHCSDISQQIQTLYDYQKLTELGWRLRFFTCRQIERALSGLFPQASVLPFGSSVNTFGRRNCDLDMILELTDDDEKTDNNRLVFQAKKSRAAANPRITMQRHMEVISDVVDNFIPGCSQVRKILGARVPIIKYYQDFTGIECDLSMTNKSGFYMSEMLYIYGCMDPRVRPLVFTIRCWAKDRHVTSVFAGRWITNFSLTLLVLFYLMRTSPPVIPPLQVLINLAGSSDRRETSGIDCTFLRDLNIVTPSENQDSLETLLRGFFEFFSNFNFKERGFSIVSGNDFVKPEHKALYIQNPLERELNVSRNVTFEELDRLNTEVSNARYLLEGLEPYTGESQSEPWGILHLCNSSAHPIALKAGNISIDWKEFFTRDELSGSVPSKKKSVTVNTTVNNANTSFNNVPKYQDKSRKNGSSIKVSRKENKEELLNASDLNGLVTKLKGRVGNKNTIKRKSKGVPYSKINYKW